MTSETNPERSDGGWQIGEQPTTQDLHERSGSDIDEQVLDTALKILLEPEVDVKILNALAGIGCVTIRDLLALGKTRLGEVRHIGDWSSAIINAAIWRRGDSALSSQWHSEPGDPGSAQELVNLYSDPDHVPFCLTDFGFCGVGTIRQLGGTDSTVTIGDIRAISGAAIETFATTGCLEAKNICHSLLDGVAHPNTLAEYDDPLTEQPEQPEQPEPEAVTVRREDILALKKQAELFCRNFRDAQQPSRS